MSKKIKYSNSCNLPKLKYHIFDDYKRKYSKPLNTIIILHGMGEDLHNAMEMINKLQIHNKVVTYNPRGFLNFDKNLQLEYTDLPDPELCPYTQERYISDMKRLVDQLNVDKIILIGESFGSIIAQLYTGSYPNKVKKLILIKPFTNFYKIGGYIYKYLLKWWSKNQLGQHIREDEIHNVVPYKVFCSIATEFENLNLIPYQKKILCPVFIIKVRFEFIGNNTVHCPNKLKTVPKLNWHFNQITGDMLKKILIFIYYDCKKEIVDIQWCLKIC